MDTIFALATARGKAGVAIVRISGPLAHRVVREMAGDLPTCRRASVRQLRRRDAILDEAIVVVFDEGASFTGEESAEFHLHGSPAVIAAVRLENLLACGWQSRVSSPGGRLRTVVWT
jgi:tRNA modification GTPase